MIDLLQATKNQTKTSELLRISFKQVNRIMYNAVERGLGRRTLAAIKHISLEEKSFKRAHNDVTVCISPETG